jgi:tetratricopeptide (TPR) repeat protein
MTANILTQFRGWLSSKIVPWFTPYWEAKKLHEGSPHGLFTKGKGLYRALTPSEIEAAVLCPRLDRAIRLYMECADRERSAGRVLNCGMALHQIGLVRHRQGKLITAQEAYEDALALLEDLPHAEVLPAISTCHFRLAEISLEHGNRSAASEHLEKSRSIDESLNDKGGLAMSRELKRLIEG